MTSRIGERPTVISTGTQPASERVTPPVASTPQPVTSPTTGWAPGTERTRRTAPISVEAVTEQQPPKALRITGHIDMTDENNWKITTASGKSIGIVPSDRGIDPPMNVAFARAFSGDTEMTVRGTLGDDGKFHVEDYCPGTSDQFTYGRVNQAGIEKGQIILNTPRGDVEVTNPELKAKFLLAPRLAVILPGDPQMKDGKLVYEGNPAQYFALARANANPAGGYTQPIEGKPGHSTFKGDLAYSFFAGKPINLSQENDASRINHKSRLWLLGDFKLADDGKSLASFEANYASKSAGESYPAPPNTKNIDDTQAASTLGAQGFTQQSLPGIEGFMLRSKAEPKPSP